ncbi:MAG: hypothetical protein KJ795_03770 [Gammaproteobacteria bacterium]|nr:hypothetical protein [Gammaproteobacteria bacterium]MBU1776132.1 hypothetical protein [Gammaproteobacteria bacterium]MBU1968845.1 hypothetical protein [Gammaproteobacteria bacterium]
MQSPELFVVSVLKALVEVAALALLAQGLVGLLAGRAKEGNVVYRMLRVVTTPVCRVVRRVTPGFVADRHIGLVAFLTLFWLWLALVYAKAWVCNTQNLACFAG